MATSALASANAGTLDVPALVGQLMSAERVPIDRLNAKITNFEAKISSIGTLKSLAATLNSASASLSASFSKFLATAADSTVVTATATSSAIAGSYALEITDIARGQRLVAAGQTSDTSAITSLASTVTIDVGGTATDVSVVAGASLKDIAAAINDKDLGITATIINDGTGTPYRLAISADKTGTAFAVASVTVKAGGDSALNDLLAFNATENVPSPAIPLTVSVPATNADFQLNGVRIIKSTNSVSDAVSGITFNLVKENSSTTVAVARDEAGISSSISAFVDAYNGLAVQLKSRTAYGSDTSSAGILAGDGTIRQMLSDMRSVVTTPATGGALSLLSSVGVSFQSDGSLKLDSTKLNSALKSGYDDVVKLFTSATGFATRMSTWSNAVIQTGGTLDAKKIAYNTTIKSTNSEIDRLELKMKALEQRYTLTYATLNQLLDSMNKTGQYLTQQFSAKSS